MTSSAHRPQTLEQTLIRSAQARRQPSNLGQALLDLDRRVGHRVRLGSCVCGRPVSAHFTKRGRFLSCHEVQSGAPVALVPRGLRPEISGEDLSEGGAR